MAEPEKKKLKLANVWREARDLIWERRFRLALGLLLMLVNRLSGLVLPGTSKYLIDEVIGRQQTEMLKWLVLAAAVATLIQSATGFALNQVLGVAAQRSITEMRKRIQQHVTQLPVRFFDSTRSGVLVSRIMNDAEGIRNLVGTGLVNLAGSLVTSVIAMGVLMYLNWRLTGLTLIVLAVFGAGMAYAFRTLRPIFRERGKLNAEVTGRLVESVSGIRVVKAYTAERRENRIFAQGVHRIFRNVAKTMTGISAVTSFSHLVLGLVGILMMVVGTRAILAGTMTLGDFIMYIFFTGLVVAPVIQISSISTQLSEAFAGLDRIREIRGEAAEDQDDIQYVPLPDLKGHVSFHQVTFAYRPGIPVLREVSFEAPPGSTTALVGPSGSGKSTLVSLILTFNRPQSGSIHVDGVDLALVRRRDYRTQLGVVLQDNFLFDGSITENIRYSRPDASPEEVRRVSRIAHCEEFILAFPDGYDTIVGERGVKLSGGQRQRVAIARALLANPRILILDEATSSLDSESEALIQDGLRSLRRGRTTFVIAHRLSTIRSADQILFLSQGEIVERGTHGELLELGGRYRQLHDRQYQLERDRFINPGEELAGEDETPSPVSTLGGEGK